MVIESQNHRIEPSNIVLQLRRDANINTF